MRLLSVPNWSFGRDRTLLREACDLLHAEGVQGHYCACDVDHNRTVTAFSSEARNVFLTLQPLCELILPAVDLNKHVGVHPRVGALDVCPFVLLENGKENLAKAKEMVKTFAEIFARTYEIPVFLYEKSEEGRHEADLPALRKGGFGGLLGKELKPDFGPTRAHPRWGVAIMGVRDFLIAMNVNLRTQELLVAKEIARRIRTLRLEGDERFLGVRALGFRLATKDMVQVSLNLTLPDITSADPIIEYVVRQAADAQVKVDATELIGVIRQKDLLGATRLRIKPQQVVDRVAHGI